MDDVDFALPKAPEKPADSIEPASDKKEQVGSIFPSFS